MARGAVHDARRRVQIGLRGYYSCRGHGRARVVSVQLGVGGEKGLFRTNRLESLICPRPLYFKNYPIVKVNVVPVRDCSSVDAFDRDLVKSRPPNASWQRVRASRPHRPTRPHSDDAASTLPDVSCRRHGCERLHTRQVSLLAPVAHPSPRLVVPVAASPIAPPSLRRRQRFKTTRA